MIFTVLVALAATISSVLAAEHGLYITTREPDWSTNMNSYILEANPFLFPGTHTEVPAGGSARDVKLVDGEGRQLNVLVGLISSTSWPTQSAIIDVGDQNVKINKNQCHWERLWADAKFNVGDITVILSPGEGRTIKTELRRARSSGKAGILDPTRYKSICQYITPDYK